MNSPDLWGKAGDREFERRFLAEVEWAAKAGANRIILALPYLIGLVKKNFPGLAVKASSALQTVTVRQALELERLGVDMICLHPSRNRDFALIRNLSNEISVPLQAIADVHCVPGCPFSATLYHSAACAVHSSDLHSPSARQQHAVTYCTSWCHEAKLREPVDLIRYPFIRPEDREVYRMAGVAQLKLATRPLNTALILARVTAFARGRHDGNLLDVVNVFPAFTQSARQERASSATDDGVERPDLPLPRPGIEEVIYMDNRALDGLLERFLDRPCPPGCEGCRHCHEFARKAISVDEQAAGELADQLAAYRRKLVDGGF